MMPRPARSRRPNLDPGERLSHEIALDIAATGMLAQQLNVEVISNNIANMNTTAYKRQRAEFQDLLYQNHPARRLGFLRCIGTIVPTGVQLGLGVQAGGGLPRSPSQGNDLS